jgi:hypothetical protein
MTGGLDVERLSQTHFPLIRKSIVNIQFKDDELQLKDEHVAKWEALPAEIWLMVFGYFEDGFTVNSASMVCLLWKYLIQCIEEHIWHQVCLTEYALPIDSELCSPSWKEAWQRLRGSLWTRDHLKINSSLHTCTLYLCNSPIPIMPGNLFHLSNLRSLNLFGDCITHLPGSIAKLTHLEILVLSNNLLETIPNGITLLQNLRELYLSSNRISSIPSEIGRLTQLTDLGLGYNCLTSLPPEIGQLTQLQYLDISNDGLFELPSTFSALKNLTELRVRDEQLPSIKQQISKVLPKLSFTSSKKRCVLCG